MRANQFRLDNFEIIDFIVNKDLSIVLSFKKQHDALQLFVFFLIEFS